MKSRHSGFTLIETIIFIAILVVVIGLGMSQIRPPKPRYERELFIARLNALMIVAWKNTIKTMKIHRISWDFNARIISISLATNAMDSATNEPAFELLSNKYGITKLTIPRSIKIENFVIEGYDEMKRYSGKQSAESWFYLTPNGVTQEVTVNFFDLKDKINNKPRLFSIILNPFSAQFETHGISQ